MYALPVETDMPKQRYNAKTATLFRAMRGTGLIAFATLVSFSGSPWASSYPSNSASYSVSLAVVTTPGQYASTVRVPGASDSVSFEQYPVSAPVPAPAQVSGYAESGPNHDGYGWASGGASARAEPGVLKAMAQANTDVVAHPSTRVGASSSVNAFAEFVDDLSFNAGTPGTVIRISGTLNLTGAMSILGNGSGSLEIGGLGLGSTTGSNTQTSWTWYSGGSRRDHTGVMYQSDWSPLSPLSASIPVTFYAVSGEDILVNYWMRARASAEGSYSICASSGGLCNVVQQDTDGIMVDFSHSLYWGGVSVTDQYGTPLAFSVSSSSGFDYAVAHSPPPVPEPETCAMLLAGLGMLGLMVKRNRLASA